MLIKYPRTYHLPFSPGASSDDKILYDLSSFNNCEIVVTEKMDGENITIYPDKSYHARSLDSPHHPSRNYLAGVIAAKDFLLSEGERICVEYCYAKHSIHYPNLESYLFLLSHWDGNICSSWDTVKFISDCIEIPLPRILYEGIFDTQILTTIASTLDTKTCEGFVIRKTSEFKYHDFSTSVAKWVRSGHVTSEEHWRTKPITKNTLKVTNHN